ncbi:MAG: LysR family transcriptional regulator [Bilifractor sp.]
MDLKQMKYFRAVADAGSISEAARILHVAQPPVSYQMKELENELGVQLFERGARHIRLTKAGHIFYTRVVRILEMADNAARDTIRAGRSQTLYLGMTSTTVSIAAPALRDFSLTHPDVHYQLYDGSTFELRHLLETGVIEGAILRTPFPVDEFNCQMIQSEPMLAGFPEKGINGISGKTDQESSAYLTHPVAGTPEHKSTQAKGPQKDAMTEFITLEDLARYPLSVYRRYYDLIDTQFTARHLTPDYFSICDDARTSLLWCINGCAVCIFPESLQPSLPEGIRTIPIASQRLQTSILFATTKDRQTSALLTEFGASLTNLYKQ